MADSLSAYLTESGSYHLPARAHDHRPTMTRATVTVVLTGPGVPASVDKLKERLASFVDTPGLVRTERLFDLGPPVPRCLRSLFRFG